MIDEILLTLTPPHVTFTAYSDLGKYARLQSFVRFGRRCFRRFSFCCAKCFDIIKRYEIPASGNIASKFNLVVRNFDKEGSRANKTRAARGERRERIKQ